MSRIDLAFARIIARNEEGRRPRLYNDANDQAVTCQPAGNVTGGYGHNFEVPMSEGLMRLILTNDLTLTDEAMVPSAGYADMDDVRASAVLDAAFNLGVTKLTRRYPHFMSAMAQHDFAEMATQLHVEQKTVDDGRYEHLRQVLLSGKENAATA